MVSTRSIRVLLSSTLGLGLGLSSQACADDKASNDGSDGPGENMSAGGSGSESAGATGSGTAAGTGSGTMGTSATTGVGTSATGADTGGDAGSDGGSSDGQDDGSGSDDGQDSKCNEDDLSELYSIFVEPFVSGAVSQSCSRCHMTGIDMSLYAQDTPCATLACMVNQNAVDLDDPESSALLSQIKLGDPTSSVFDIQWEHDAMLEWINWSAQCHQSVCGEISDACNTGTGADSTGINPIGDCSEADLLAVFWDTVIADRGRCVTCHADFAVADNTFGPCSVASDCPAPKICAEGFCRNSAPWLAPKFFTGMKGDLAWDNAEHRAIALDNLYNILALGQIDVDSPLDSKLLTKPLIEGFQPTAVFGKGVSIPSVPKGVGVGVVHGGDSKFNFDCHEPPCPTSGAIDCTGKAPCSGDDCGAPALCDQTYTNYVHFIEYFSKCSKQHK